MKPRGAAGARAGASTACCCSTSRAGLSSNAALQRAQAPATRAAKAGHTGTLDPLATGLLPLVLRRGDQVRAGAARRAEGATSRRVRFGVATTTGDAEGEVVAHVPSRRSIARATRGGRCRASSGRSRRFRRATPRSSTGGRAYYDYARAGVEIPRAAARDRDRRARRCVDWRRPTRCIDVACSKGTYIRVLAEDIGRGARLLRAPRRAAPHRRRAVSLARRGDARRARGDGRRGARRAAAAGRRAWSRTCRGSTLDADGDAARFAARRRGGRRGRRPGGRCVVYGRRTRFSGWPTSTRRALGAPRARLRRRRAARLSPMSA